MVVGGRGIQCPGLPGPLAFSSSSLVSLWAASKGWTAQCVSPRTCLIPSIWLRNLTKDRVQRRGSLTQEEVRSPRKIDRPGGLIIRRFAQIQSLPTTIGSLTHQEARPPRGSLTRRLAHQEVSSPGVSLNSSTAPQLHSYKCPPPAQASKDFYSPYSLTSTASAAWPIQCIVYILVAYSFYPKACFARVRQHPNQEDLQEDRWQRYPLSTRSSSSRDLLSPRFTLWEDCCSRGSPSKDHSMRGSLSKRFNIHKTGPKALHRAPLYSPVSAVWSAQQGLPSLASITSTAWPP